MNIKDIKVCCFYFSLASFLFASNCFAGIIPVKFQTEKNFSFARAKTYPKEGDMSGLEFKSHFLGDAFLISFDKKYRFNGRRFKNGRIFDLNEGLDESEASERLKKEVFTMSSFFHQLLPPVGDTIGVIEIPDDAQVHFNGYFFKADRFKAIGKITKDRLFDLMTLHYKGEYNLLMNSETAKTCSGEETEQNGEKKSELSYQAYMDILNQNLASYIDSKDTSNPNKLLKILYAFHRIMADTLHQAYLTAYTAASGVYYGASTDAVDPVVKHSMDWKYNSWYKAMCMIGSDVDHLILVQDRYSFDNWHDTSLATNRAINYVIGTHPDSVLSLELLEGSVSKATAKIYEDAKSAVGSQSAHDLDIALQAAKLCKSQGKCLGRGFYNQAQRNALISTNENLKILFDSALSVLEELEVEVSKAQLQELLGKIEAKLEWEEIAEDRGLYETLLSPVTVIIKKHVEDLPE